MNLTRTSSIRIIRFALIVTALSIIIGYASWRSFNYARGPEIVVNEPSNWSIISASTTMISGRVERANNITLNGKPMFIDEQGNFRETIIIFPGTNIITLVAQDQFNRIVEQTMHLSGK